MGMRFLKSLVLDFAQTSALFVGRDVCTQWLIHASLSFSELNCSNRTVKSVFSTSIMYYYNFLQISN